MPEAEIGTAKLFDEILSYTNSCGGKWKVFSFLYLKKFFF